MTPAVPAQPIGQHLVSVHSGAAENREMIEVFEVGTIPLEEHLGRAFRHGDYFAPIDDDADRSSAEQQPRLFPEDVMSFETMAEYREWRDARDRELLDTRMRGNDSP